jgi:formimidoylglutamate deiminase
LLVLDPHALLGVPQTSLLDALVFATNETAISDVYVAGKKVIANGKHPQQDNIANQFADVMHELWGD